MEIKTSVKSELEKTLLTSLECGILKFPQPDSLSIKEQKDIITQAIQALLSQGLLEPNQNSNQVSVNQNGTKYLNYLRNQQNEVLSPAVKAKKRLQANNLLILKLLKETTFTISSLKITSGLSDYAVRKSIISLETKGLIISAGKYEYSLSSAALDLLKSKP